MKPHEETWVWDENWSEVVANPDDPSLRRTVVETDSGVYPPRAGEGRELIVCAPEMARMILRLCREYPSTDGSCVYCGQYETQPHLPTCAVGTLLRRAGVLP